jgi:hypothetical protein
MRRPTAAEDSAARAADAIVIRSAATLPLSKARLLPANVTSAAPQGTTTATHRRVPPMYAGVEPLDAPLAAAVGLSLDDPRDLALQQAALAVRDYLEAYRPRPTALRPTLLVTDSFSIPRSATTAALSHHQQQQWQQQHVEQAPPAVGAPVHVDPSAPVPTRAAPQNDPGTARTAAAEIVASAPQAPPARFGSNATRRSGSTNKRAGTEPPPPPKYRFVSLASSAELPSSVNTSYASLHESRQEPVRNANPRAGRGGAPLPHSPAPVPRPKSSEPRPAVHFSPRPLSHRAEQQVAEHAPAQKPGVLPTAAPPPRSASAQPRSVSAGTRPAFASATLSAASMPAATQPQQRTPQQQRTPAAVALSSTPGPAPRQTGPPRQQPRYRTTKLREEAERLAAERAAAAIIRGPQQLADAEERRLLKECLERLDQHGCGNLLRLTVNPGAAPRNPVTLSSAGGIRDGVALVAAINLLLTAADQSNPMRPSPSKAGTALSRESAFVPRSRLEVTKAPHVNVSAAIMWLNERLGAVVPLPVLYEHPVPQQVRDLRLEGIVEGSQNLAVLHTLLYLLDLIDSLNALPPPPANAPSSAVTPTAGDRAAAHRRSPSPPLTGRTPSTPTTAGRRRRYGDEFMLQLEAAACSFLLQLQILPEPNPSLQRQIHHRGLPTALEAPYVPMKPVMPPRVRPILSLTDPFVFPYLRNGTALCDAVSVTIGPTHASHPTLRRGPRVEKECLAFIAAAQSAVRAHTSHPSALFLDDPRPIYDGNTDFILGFLEDLMRCAYRVPPRDGPPAPEKRPFIPQSTMPFDSRPGDTFLPRPSQNSARRSSSPLTAPGLSAPPPTGQSATLSDDDHAAESGSPTMLRNPFASTKVFSSHRSFTAAAHASDDPATRLAEVFDSVTPERGDRSGMAAGFYSSDEGPSPPTPPRPRVMLVRVVAAAANASATATAGTWAPVHPHQFASRFCAAHVTRRDADPPASITPIPRLAHAQPLRCVSQRGPASASHRSHAYSKPLGVSGKCGPGRQ